MAKRKKSETWAESLKMKPVKVKLEQIYLDPNNPRLETPGKVRVPDERITESGIRQRCMQQMQDIGINDLVGSIKTNGFWGVDKVVLRPLDSDKYVVVEGNRRVSALKTLLYAYIDGKIELPDEVYRGIIEFEVLIYTGKNPEIAWLIQGFRHTPGARPWDYRGNKYPLAKFLANVRESGRSIPEIASMLGRKNSEVTSLVRSYYAFEQARKDEEFGDQINAEKFGYFDEIILKIPSLKNWVGWDEKKFQFKDNENIRKFLSWIVSGKIDTISRSTAKTLTKIIQPEYKDLLLSFEQDDDMDIHQCEEKIYKAETKREPVNIADIIENLKSTEKSINTLPIPQLQLAKTKDEKKQKTQILEIMKSLVRILNAQIRNLK